MEIYIQGSPCSAMRLTPPAEQPINIHSRLETTSFGAYSSSEYASTLPARRHDAPGALRRLKARIRLVTSQPFVSEATRTVYPPQLVVL